MFRKLKHYSAKSACDSWLEEHRPTAVKNLRKVGVILDVDLFENNAFKDIETFQRELNIEADEFHVILFSSKGKKIEKVSSTFFRRSDLSWKGTFKKESYASSFIREKYDLLINYFLVLPFELLMLSASTKANLKIGFLLPEKRLNDLEVLTEPAEVATVGRELKKYIAIINK